MQCLHFTESICPADGAVGFNKGLSLKVIAAGCHHTEASAAAAAAAAAISTAAALVCCLWMLHSLHCAAAWDQYVVRDDETSDVQGGTITQAVIQHCNLHVNDCSHSLKNKWCIFRAVLRFQSV